MAGIGFELKKIYKKEGISRALLGIFYSSMVTIGPTILIILTILALYLFLGLSQISYGERELLSSTILYVFIFSVLLTAPINVVLSRYLADKFYEEEFHNILSSYYVGVTLCCSFGTILFLPVGYSLLQRGNVDWKFLIFTYIFWIVALILFFSITYLHATKDYKMIAWFFLIGMLITVIFAIVSYFLLSVDEIHSILYGFTIGFFVIAVLEFSYIRKYFQYFSNRYMESIRYFFSHKRLMFSNFFYMLGLYIHNFIFWTVPGRLHIAGTYYTNQTYDMATCLAMFTNVSTMIFFIVVAETRFHTAYQRYMESVIGGTYKSIFKNKRILFRIIAQQMRQILGVQIAITSVVFFLIITFASSLGIQGMTIQVYPVLSVAFMGVFMMYGNMIYLYYFSDMTGAFLTAFIFCSVTGIMTFFVKDYAMIWWGMGIFIGMILGWLFSFFRIKWIEKHIDQHIFCHGTVVDTIAYREEKPVYKRDERDGK